MLVVYAFFIPIDSHAKSSLLSVMLILFIYKGDIWKSLKEVLSNKVVQVFTLLYFFWIFGFTYTENIKEAVNGMYKAKYLLLPLFFLTFLDKRYAFRVLTAFVIGMLFSELVSYSISLHIFPEQFYIADFKVYKTIYHDPAPFFNHIDHSIGLAVVVSLLLYQFLNNKQSIIVKTISILFMLSASINMSFIGGRTGYVTYIILIITTFLISSKNQIKKSIVISILLVSFIASMAYSISPMINSRVNQTVESLKDAYNNENFETSLGIRIGLVKYSLGVISENIFFGVGTGDAIDEVKKTVPSNHKGILRMGEMHNVYIQTMLQFGLFGLCLLFYLFYRVWNYPAEDKKKSDILKLLTMTIILVMIPGKFYGHFVLPMYATIVSAMIANKEQNIKYKIINKSIIFKYLILVFIFYVIAIVR